MIIPFLLFTLVVRLRVFAQRTKGKSLPQTKKFTFPLFFVGKPKKCSKKTSSFPLVIYFFVQLSFWSQSYTRNSVLKKIFKILNSILMHYFNLDDNWTVIQSKVDEMRTNLVFFKLNLFYMIASWFLAMGYRKSNKPSQTKGSIYPSLLKSVM